MERLTINNRIEIAKQNIKELDGLYRGDQLDKLQVDLDRLGYFKVGRSRGETRVNVGSGDSSSRIDEIGAPGLTDYAYDECMMNKIIMNIWLVNDLFN